MSHTMEIQLGRLLSQGERVEYLLEKLAQDDARPVKLKMFFTKGRYRYDVVQMVNDASDFLDRVDHVSSSQSVDGDGDMTLLISYKERT